MRIKTFLIPISLISLLILPVYYANAQENGNSANEGTTYPRQDLIEQMQKDREEGAQKAKERADGLKAEIQQRVEERCEDVELRVAERIERFIDNKDMHVENYNAVIEKLNEISAKAGEMGLDTTELDAAIGEFQSLVENYAAEYVSFIDMLSEAQSLVCGESEGEYRDMLRLSRNQLLTAREARIATRSYYAEEVRGAIQDLRDQVANSAEEVTNE